MYFVETFGKMLDESRVIEQPAKKIFLPMQPGDVYQTYADVSELIHDFGFKPDTSLEQGLQRFANWYAQYYKRAEYGMKDTIKKIVGLDAEKLFWIIMATFITGLIPILYYIRICSMRPEMTMVCIRDS